MVDLVRLTFVFPIAQFKQIPGDAVTLAFNTLIGDINKALVALGANPAGFVTNRQLRSGLKSQGQLFVVSGAIPGDISSDVNIEWNSGNTVAVGDTLYNFIQTTLGYTSAQMTTLFALALTFPP